MIFRHLALAFLTIWGTQCSAWNSPTQTSPSNGSSTWLETTLDWNAVNASEAYQLEVDTSAAFDSPLLLSATQAYLNSSDGNIDTKRALSGLRFGTTYRWRVRAYVTGDTSAWSTTRTFVTRDVVNLITPTTGASVWTTVSMDWDASPGVDFYDAQLDTSANFDSALLSEVTKVYLNGSDLNMDTRWDQEGLFFGKTYHWRVRARTTADTSSWGVVRSFNTRNGVVLTAPADLALNQNVSGITLNWNAHVGVTTYQLQWDTTYQFNSALLQDISKPYANGSDVNLDTEHPSGTLLTNQWYAWRVRALNAVDTSAWTMRRFSTGSTLPQEPAIPALTAPANGVTVVAPLINLEWAVATSATAYEYRFSTLPDLSDATPTASAGAQVQVGPMITGTTYFWAVRSLNGVNASEWSVIWSFTYDSTTDISSIATGSLRIFPNPSTSSITVALSVGSALRMVLSDATGRTVRDERVTGNTFRTDLSDLRPGTYVLRVFTTQGVITRALVRSF